MSKVLTVVLLVATGLAVAAGATRTPSPGACLTPGQWFTPDGERTAAIAQPMLLKELAAKRVVLLGEHHDDADHHRWQLQVIAALQAQQPNLVIGMEMLPRHAQPVLDAWVSGKLTESELLTRTSWGRVWGFDPALYLPILHFARLNRVPVVALNVDRSVISDIGANGLSALPPERREGVGRPAAARQTYRDRLEAAFREHGSKATGGTAAFERFVEAQLFWDRAFAEALVAAANRPGAPLVIGIMGSGHLADGDGVPHQLADLGFAGSAVLLPVESNTPCSELPAGLAQAVFAVAPVPPAPSRPLLGVRLEPASEGVRIADVTAGSVADRAGLKAGDVLREVASRPVKESHDVIVAVARQAPGTWLPVTVARDGGQIDLVAKFPPEP